MNWYFCETTRLIIILFIYNMLVQDSKLRDILCFWQINFWSQFFRCSIEISYKDKIVSETLRISFFSNYSHSHSALVYLLERSSSLGCKQFLWPLRTSARTLSIFFELIVSRVYPTHFSIRISTACKWSCELGKLSPNCLDE